MGLAGTGAASGLAVGHFEWLATFVFLLLGWVFVPFYLRSGAYTMPEFVERRYNAASRWYLSTVSIIGYGLTKISVTLFAGGVVVRELTGLTLWAGAGVAEPADADVTARVDVVELLGSEELVHLRLAGAKDLLLHVVFPGDAPVNEDETIGLRFRRERLHFFDAADGRRLS